MPVLEGLCMPYSFPRYTGLSLFASVVLVLGTAFAQNPVPDPSGSLRYPPKKVGPFLVTFSWLTPRVQIAEPLWFRLSYQNTSSSQKHRFQISWSFHGDIRAYLRYPRHEPVRVLGAYQETVPFSSTFEVEPGETHSLEDFILYIPEALTGLATESPGELTAFFQVRCTAVSSEDKTLEYLNLPITVLPPTAETQRVLDYLDSLPDLESARLLIQSLQGLTASDQITPWMTNLVEAAPHSALAPLALYSLGALSNTRGRAADQVRYFQEVQRRYPGHFLADDALWLAARGLRNLGNVEEARAEVIRLTRLYPESNRLRLVDEFYNATALPTLRPAHPGMWMLFDSWVAPTTSEWEELLNQGTKPTVVFDSSPSEEDSLPVPGVSAPSAGLSR